jgi:hypothetical protein
MDIMSGLAYSNVGLGIKCVVDAWVKAHGDSIIRGIPVKCTDAWMLMQDAMKAIETLLQTEDADIDLPCFTEKDGSDSYYTPLQYLCVLDKSLMPGSWTSDLAKKLSLQGASHELPDFWDLEMKSHANLLLTCRESAGQ